MNIFKRIKFLYWWYFKATDREKINWDMITKGTAIEKDGKRINPNKFYIK